MIASLFQTGSTMEGLCVLAVGFSIVSVALIIGYYLSDGIDL